MKTIGLIGGTGWVSTLEYYRLLNQEVNSRLGGLNAAKCLIYSFNYAELAALNQENNHAGVLRMVVDAAQKLELSGVDGIALCANTLHFYADDLQNQITKPIIHIASATADTIRREGISTIGLLGTKITMEENFYKNRLNDSGIHTIIPNERERAFIHRSIFSELLKEVFLDSTKKEFLSIISNLKQQGAEGIVLGCTEIPLLIGQKDVDIPIFNTLGIHVKAMADFIIQ